MAAKAEIANVFSVEKLNVGFNNPKALVTGTAQVKLTWNISLTVAPHVNAV